MYNFRVEKAISVFFWTPLGFFLIEIFVVVIVLVFVFFFSFECGELCIAF